MTSDGAFTRRLAEYCADTRLEDIPKAVREKAKYVILDGLGCGLFGSVLPWSRILTRTVAPLSAGGPSVVWGTNLRLPPDHASLLNGSYIQAYELDDGHPGAGLHESANVLPAALASADLAGPVSGADLLTAIIVGYEVGPRVGMCVGAPRMLEAGWHSGSVVGTFAAAAGAGRVLGLTPEQMAHAFGIAGTQSCGLMASQFGSMVKRMNHGRSSQSGLYAATLARHGYTGISQIFEQRYGGFCTTFTGTVDGFHLERLTGGLGSDFETEHIRIKPYSCNGSIHSSLDAVRNIRKRRAFTSLDVRSISIRCTRATHEHVGWEYRPDSMTTAQMNLSFGVAAMIEYGDVFIDQFTAETIRSPRLLDLTGRIKVIHEPEFDLLGASHRHQSEVTIELRDGTVETETVVRSPGLRAGTADNERIIHKYDRMALEALSAEQSEALKKRVLHLEEVDDARSLGALLCGTVLAQDAGARLFNTMADR